MTKTIHNMNAQATVQLTPEGVAILERYCMDGERAVASMCNGMVFRHPLRDAFDGTSLTSTLWQIMHIFGSSLSMGSDVPFVENEIMIEWRSTDFAGWGPETANSGCRCEASV